jgi:hypothetical protein
MSFRIRFTKNVDGTYQADHLAVDNFDHLPEVIDVSGHIESNQVVDLSARVDGLMCSSSRREYGI